jgi:hypothetical protein
MAKAPRPIVDPEFSSLLGPLCDVEFAQRKTNIEEDGQREPIVVWAAQNIVLEGHNRLSRANSLLEGWRG